MTTYQLPATRYFNSLGPRLSLRQKAGYAGAREAALRFGPNVQSSVVVPFHGSTEYSPYGADLLERGRELIDCLQATQDPDQQRRIKAELSELTGRWHQALVAGPTTAPLGVPAAPMTPDGSRIWGRMGRAIYAGKSKYILRAVGINTDFQAVETELTNDMMGRIEAERDPRRKTRLRNELHARMFAETVLRVSCNYGFINIEDARGADVPIILSVLECLRGECGVWDDDMMGTGIVTAIGFLSWAQHSGRTDLSKLRGVILGAGAGGYGVYKELINHGLLPNNIMVTDTGPNKDDSGRPHPLHEERTDFAEDPYKMEMRKGISADMTVDAFLEGADFVINLGDMRTVTRDPVWTEKMVRRLAENFILAAMTNPDAGIGPEQLWSVRKDGYYASGDQTKPNPFNNFIGFTQMALGVVLARAGWVGPEMTIAAAKGGAKLAMEGPPDWLRPQLPSWRQEFGRGWLVPHPEDTRLILHEARAIALAAVRHGYSTALGPNPHGAELAAFEGDLDRELEFRKELVEENNRSQDARGRIFLQRKFPDQYDPFSLRPGEYPIFHINPDVDTGEFSGFATCVGVKVEQQQKLLDEQGKLYPKSLTTLLAEIRDSIEHSRDTADGAIKTSRMAIANPDEAFKELELIVYLSKLNPALGLALALRRLRVRADNLAERPTIFHRPAVLRTILDEIPSAWNDIQRTFPSVNFPEGLMAGVG